MISENITKVLYPNDEPPSASNCGWPSSTSSSPLAAGHPAPAGRLRRAARSAASGTLRDPAQRHPPVDRGRRTHATADRRAQPRLGRGVADHGGDHGLHQPRCCPEALETWPLSMFEQFLPRHLQIIYEINRRFLDEVRARFPGDEGRVRRMSLIGEDGGRSIRMAHLATVGSHAINGVAALHSELLKSTVLKTFTRCGRRGSATRPTGSRRAPVPGSGEPQPARVAEDTIGQDWMVDLDRLRGLEAYADDPAFQKQWRDEAPTNPTLPPTSPRRRASAWTRLDVRCPGQADTRIQASAPQRAAISSRSTTASRMTRASRSRPGIHFSEAGRAQLHHGEADHQADQRHRHDGEQ